ncbi:MAG: hypothetical protein ACE5GH_00190 [Fidelibacterota bacterium]
MKKLGQLAVIIIMAFSIASAGKGKGPKTFDLASYESNKKATADKYFKVAGGKHIKGVKKVFIPSFQTEFVTYIDKYSGGATMNITMTNADNAYLQSLTNSLYEKFVSSLREAGIEVISQAELQGNEDYQTLIAAGAEVPAEFKMKGTKKRDGRESLIFSPEGIPVYRGGSLTGTSVLFSSGGSVLKVKERMKLDRAEPKMIDDLGAAMIKFHVEVGFAELVGKGKKVSGKSAFSISNCTVGVSNKVKSYSMGKKGKQYYLDKGASIQHNPKWDPKMELRADAEIAEFETNVAFGSHGSYNAIIEKDVHSDVFDKYTTALVEMATAKLNESL